MKAQLKDNFFTLFLYLPIVSIFSVGFFIYGWDKQVIALFIIAIFLCCYKYKLNTIKENIKDPYVIILLISTIYGSTLYQTIGYGSSEIRTLIACCLFFLFFPKEKISIVQLPQLLVIASICSFAFTAYSKFVLNVDRATWPFNPIPYAMTLCMLATCCLHYFIRTKSKLLFATFFLFSVTIFLTESRGPILSLIATSVLLLLLTLVTKKNVHKVTISVIAFSLITISFTHQLVINRVNATQQEFSTISSGDYNTSIGLRFQMWLAAPEIIKTNPIIGVGDDFKNEIQILSERNSFFKPLAEFSPNHFHNQFIDKFVRAGAIGLLLCLLIMYYPLYKCWTNKKVISKQNRIIVTLTAVSITISSLTDVPMNQSFCLFPFLLLSYFALNARKV
ncbi:O-antigen ligase family protein [Photobacterium rosenbergii]|uniref:O-antigen ligase family protein n=1 Tax=Photobacterium rosenbergii TaxID=294936 RepID=UPI001C98E5C9|nr:O-antigen ligase family protein [Photobacterium rosenbergii]MBY5947157.1 O-antigen ligase family protein [Photobacterium rosenbergii]